MLVKIRMRVKFWKVKKMKGLREREKERKRGRRSYYPMEVNAKREREYINKGITKFPFIFQLQLGFHRFLCSSNNNDLLNIYPTPLLPPSIFFHLSFCSARGSFRFCSLECDWDSFPFSFHSFDSHFFFSSFLQGRGFISSCSSLFVSHSPQLPLPKVCPISFLLHSSSHPPHFCFCFSFFNLFSTHFLGLDHIRYSFLLMFSSIIHHFCYYFSFLLNAGD